jgi:hypothetical protein
MCWCHCQHIAVFEQTMFCEFFFCRRSFFSFIYDYVVFSLQHRGRKISPWTTLCSIPCFEHRSRTFWNTNWGKKNRKKGEFVCGAHHRPFCVYSLAVKKTLISTTMLKFYINSKTYHRSWARRSRWSRKLNCVFFFSSLDREGAVTNTHADTCA